MVMIALPTATAEAATARIAIAQVSRYPLSRFFPRGMERSSNNVTASSSSSVSQQTRLVSRSSQRPIPRSKLPSSLYAPPTLGSLRTKAATPFETQKGKPYVSPYAEFFANVEAGRSSLGTTTETERPALELREHRLQCGIPESALRFRTASYGRYMLPPYVSPGEHRVTVKVALSAIPFENEREKEALLQIVGSRFNLKKGDLQLSSEKFASRVENKRLLVDMIERIVTGARVVAKEYADEETSCAAK